MITQFYKDMADVFNVPVKQVKDMNLVSEYYLNSFNKIRIDMDVLEDILENDGYNEQQESMSFFVKRKYGMIGYNLLLKYI